jgi:hypothetical protein
MSKYLYQDEIQPGVLFNSRSYHSDKMIPALVVGMEATATGVQYVRAVDTDGESFLAEPSFLERIQ